MKIKEISVKLKDNKIDLADLLAILKRQNFEIIKGGAIWPKNQV